MTLTEAAQVFVERVEGVIGGAPRPDASVTLHLPVKEFLDLKAALETPDVLAELPSGAEDSTVL
jgi:hypothetical protein